MSSGWFCFEENEMNGMLVWLFVFPFRNLLDYPRVDCSVIVVAPAG